MLKRFLVRSVLVLAAFVPIACGVNGPVSSSGGVTAEAACPAGNLYIFRNNNAYPVWLGEGYQGASTTIVAPTDNNWMLAPGDSVDLCMPAGWSGRFWPRTECDFSGYYANDPGYKSCTSTSQCGGGHVCYGGQCMLDCSTGDTPFCQGANGLNRPNAVCIHSSFTGDVHYCSYPQNTVCKTGDCQGLYQCYGKWDTNVAQYGATGPVALFEPTSTNAQTVNYDISLVSGYNSQMQMQLSVPTSPQPPSNCYAPGCTSDLNQSCPANLAVTEAPTTTPGPVPCGTGKYCQSGVCKNNSTCVIACNDPSDQCQASNPPGLMCNTVVPGGDGSTYADMYFAKNSSGKIKPTTAGTMISGNQGNATCWGTADCQPGETCTKLISNLPNGIGVCVPPSPQILQPQINCHSQTDVGKACGNYSPAYADALGYRCASYGSGASQVVCLLGFNPPITGLGTFESNGDFWRGTGSPINPEWKTAAAQAGGGTPWYQAFTAACPNTYGWQYDDHAGGFSCNSGTGGPNVNITITFGPPTAMAATQQHLVFRMKLPSFEPHETLFDLQRSGTNQGEGDRRH